MKRKNKQIVNFSVVGLLALAVGGGASFMAFGGSGGQTTNVAFVGNNGQNWNDGGFNTNSHNAITEYTDNNDNAKFKTDSYGAYSNDGSTYMDPTMKAFNQGDDIVVSSGFNFAGAIMGYDEFEPDAEYGDPPIGHVEGVYGDPVPGSNYSENYGDKQVVLADDTLLAGLYTNAVSINYMSQGGGFLAGLASAMYSTAWQISSPVGEHNLTNVVTCYGGLDINVNYDYMSGFEQGVNYWNYAALGYDIADHTEHYDSINDQALPKITSPGGDIATGTEVNLLNNGGTLVDKNGKAIAPIEVAIPVGETAGGQQHTMYYSSDSYNEFDAKDIDGGNTLANNEDDKDTYYNNWTTGGFPTTESDAPGVGAKDIAAWGTQENVATIFPIAGASTMYTYRQMQSGNTHAGKNGQPGITQVIGVDSDAVAGDPTSDEYILGSATKNLEMGIQYSVWAADYKQGGAYQAVDMYGNPDPIDPSDNIEDSTDFMMPLTPVNEGDTIGWNYSADVNTDVDENCVPITANDIPGQQFTGTIDNGGSYFTPGAETNGSEGYELEDSLAIIIEESGIGNDEITLKDIADAAVAENPVIEYHSHSFSENYDAPFDGVTVTRDIMTNANSNMSHWMLNYNLDAIEQS